MVVLVALWLNIPMWFMILIFLEIACGIPVQSDLDIA
jgi:hypothetical protein